MSLGGKERCKPLPRAHLPTRPPPCRLGTRVSRAGVSRGRVPGEHRPVGLLLTLPFMRGLILAPCRTIVAVLFVLDSAPG
jgi:hypothetical protein